jgi:hypothetical protein
MRTVKCPAPDNYVVFRAEYGKLNFRHKLLNLLKYSMRRFHRGQIHKGSLFWEVVEMKGECPAMHTLGDKFYINKGKLQITKNVLFPMGDAEGLCPAVFDSIFAHSGMTDPAVFGFPEGDLDEIRCPDRKADICCVWKARAAADSKKMTFFLLKIPFRKKSVRHCIIRCCRIFPPPNTVPNSAPGGITA